MDYLAFDFGDGTTCAAHYDDSFYASGMAPEKLSILRGEDEIWSVIGYDKNGENPYIGKHANRPGYKIRSNWKAKPSEYTSSGPDAWKRGTAVDFMRIVFRNFLENNQAYSKKGTYNGKPCTIVIGVPCDWKSVDIKEYKKMAKEAGLPNVQVVKESQAAMFYARRFMRGGIPDEDIREGVLLIDVGSSTTDFTYMRGADQVRHCGLALGAQAVERSFLAEAQIREKVRYFPDKPESGVHVLADNTEDAERMRTRDAMRAREYKESYFRCADQCKDPQQETMPLPVSKMSIGEVWDGTGYITGTYVNYCLNDDNTRCKFKLTQLSDEWKEAELDSRNTWRGHFRTALRHVKKKWELTSSTAIVVTGGASRMQFVEEDIVGVFQPSKKPYFGDDGARSFSVVKGLAWCGFARDQIAKKRRNVESLFRDSRFVEKLGIGESVDDLLDEPSREIASRIRDTICGALQRHESCVNTCNKIGKKYSDLMCSEWNSLSKKLNKGIAIKVVLEKKVLEGLTNSLYESFGRPEIKADRDVKAAFRYNMVRADIDFDPLAGIFWRPENDREFDSCVLDKWSRVENTCRNKITADVILEDNFKASLVREATGEEIPSFWQHLYDAILVRVREFKLMEIDALSGALEYGDSK